MCTYSLPLPYFFQSASSDASLVPLVEAPKGFSCETAHHSGRPTSRYVRDAGACNGVGEERKCGNGWRTGGDAVASRSYRASFSPRSTSFDKQANIPQILLYPLVADLPTPAAPTTHHPP